MSEAPRLYLITPAVVDPVAFRPLLQAALAEGDVACLHLQIAPPEAHQAKRFVQALAPLAQERGAAVLIDPPADLREVARLGVDGVHCPASDAVGPALQALKPDRIVGAGGLKSRDAAMAAGETGADYVMFGEPRPDGSLPPLDQVAERCRWWAEVFTIPCVGYAPSHEAVAVLRETGAEFVALGPWAFASPAA